MVGIMVTSSERTYDNTPHLPVLLLPLTPSQVTPLQETLKHSQTEAEHTFFYSAIGGKLNERFTSHGPAHESKTQLSSQPVAPITSSS